VGKSCIAPAGSYTNTWVTVAGVKAHLDGAGWVDLTPNLSPSNPTQVDLLSEQSHECFLATLGATTGLQAGKYTQIRIMLEPNDATGVTLPGGVANACASVNAWNCVVDAAGAHTLKLSSAVPLPWRTRHLASRIVSRLSLFRNVGPRVGRRAALFFVSRRHPRHIAPEALSLAE
jgi:hypothetical protein